jgi:hypothetical protein
LKTRDLVIGQTAQCKRQGRALGVCQVILHGQDIRQVIALLVFVRAKDALCERDDWKGLIECSDSILLEDPEVAARRTDERE